MCELTAIANWRNYGGMDIVACRGWDHSRHCGCVGAAREVAGYAGQVRRHHHRRGEGVRSGQLFFLLVNEMVKLWSISLTDIYPHLLTLYRKIVLSSLFLYWCPFLIPPVYETKYTIDNIGSWALFQQRVQGRRDGAPCQHWHPGQPGGGHHR